MKRSMGLIIAFLFIMIGTISYADTTSLPQSLITIEDRAFFNDTSLDSVVLQDGVKSIGAFSFSNSSLSSINLPDSLEYIGPWAFANTRLSSINIPSNVTHIGEKAFSNSNFITITLSEGIKSIDSLAFADTTVSVINLPSTLQSIGENAFENSNISTVNIADGIISIESNAFANATITNFYLPPSIESIGENAFGNNTSLIVYGTAGSYAESYCDNNGIPFVDQNQELKQFFVNFYDMDENIVSSIKYNYGEPLVVPSVAQQVFLNETYCKYHTGWVANGALVELPKYVRTNWDLYAYYEIRPVQYSSYVFSTKYPHNVKIPTNWSIMTQTSDGSVAYPNSDIRTVYTNGEFSIEFRYFQHIFGFGYDAREGIKKMLSDYSTTGTGTSERGVTYSYGIKGNSKRVLKELNDDLTRHYLSIEATNMTNNQMTWFNYIVSTLSE